MISAGFSCKVTERYRRSGKEGGRKREMEGERDREREREGGGGRETSSLDFLSKAISFRIKWPTASV